METTPNSQTILVSRPRNLSWNPLFRTSLVKLPRTSRHKFNPETLTSNIKCFFMNSNNNDTSNNCRSIIIKQKCIEDMKNKGNSLMPILGLSLEGKGLSDSGWNSYSGLVENLRKNIFIAVKSLQKLAMAVMLFGVVLLMCESKFAFAASGGRMVGKSFSSPSSSSSSSSSIVCTSRGTDDWPEFSDSAVPYFAPPPSSFSCGGGAAVYARPAVGVGTAGSSFSYIMMGFTSFVLVSGLLSSRAEGDLLSAAEKTSVMKIQVGLLGMAGSLQRDLNRIAEAADTSSPEGLHYILTETILALLRYPSYWISACSSVDVKHSVEGGEKRFNQLSVEERSKFDKETLINVNNIRKQTPTAQSASVFSNEYIVVTLLVAASGLYNLPTINSSSDLKDALQKLASVTSSGTMAVEVLWTPQNENDSLSERELLEDYPFLQPI